MQERDLAILGPGHIVSTLLVQRQGLETGPGTCERDAKNQ